MGVHGFGACVLTAATIVTAAAAAGSRDVPRFMLSTTTATIDQAVVVRAATAPGSPRGEIRLYLVPRGAVASVRSRFDPRLSFVGTLGASPRARVVVTVPPLDTGLYVLAYWCRGCVAHENAVGVQTSPTLRVEARAGEGCSTTRVNGRPPRGAPPALSFHGNGELATWLRTDGILVTNALGGHKMIWIARRGSPQARLAVRYWRLDVSSPPLDADTVSGTLHGYDGHSWASRMSFEPGCWQVTGRLGDVSLSFVVRVERGTKR
jgi:hypothetical protein